MDGKKVEVLDIPDDYGFMDPELIEMLSTALNDYGLAPPVAD